MRVSIMLAMLLAPILSLAAAVAARAEPVTFDVGEFSERHYARVTVEREALGEVFIPGVIRVYDRKHPGKPIITIESEELTFDVDEGKIRANVHELPYGEQSLLIHEDFNFDGKKDLALMDGQFSCYHGPSFQVYLANDKGGFTHNEDFTGLAQEYCGFFQTNAEEKTIRVMTKSGCCWHLFETYEVDGDRLRRIYAREEGMLASGNYLEETVIEGSGKSEKTTHRYTLPGEDYTGTPPPIAFRFGLKSAPRKEVVLLFEYGMADYVLLNKKDKDKDRAEVEYSYELAAAGVMPPGKSRGEHILTLDAENDSVCFGIGDTTYTVIDQPGRLGVQVKQGRRVTFLAGDPDTRDGDLAAIRAADNVKPGTCPLE
ncbi:MAG: hypothetical protein LBD68_08830 [Zoogloeaceae bacterium]|nr:hypothetical protein [Zoogloeaceae bacterium]